MRSKDEIDREYLRYRFSEFVKERYRLIDHVCTDHCQGGGGGDGSGGGGDGSGDGTPRKIQR